jgi:hypothetical protein
MRKILLQKLSEMNISNVTGVFSIPGHVLKAHSSKTRMQDSVALSQERRSAWQGRYKHEEAEMVIRLKRRP